ncbi:MAG: DUF4349 domain-containing protein [Oscillospiraceae bacterium]|nr:DUF4349 domain-containing protein [Oscillospiraceae bacterium]
MKKMLALCLSLCLLLSFAGCAAKSAPMEDMKAEANYGSYGGIYDGAADMEMSQSAPAEKPAAGSANSTGSAGVQNQKLIRTMTLETETEDLDTLLASLDQKIKTLGGYVENKNIRNGSASASRRYRYANLTIRVPVDQLDAFVEHVSGASNVVHYSENAKDITLSYVATQSRITALETEQTRLLELLAQAENMSDLLQIEQRLTDVRTELEQVTSQLRLYDNLVDYGTIELSVTEVQEYTPVEKETMWQRMGSGLKSSWQALGEFSENLLVFLVTALPWLIPISIIVALWIATGKKRRARRAERKAAKKAKKAQQPEPPQEA